MGGDHRSFERRQELYQEVIAYSPDPLMTALARVAQGKISGQGCILTRDEVISLYRSVQDQIENTLRDHRENLGRAPQTRRAH